MAGDSKQRVEDCGLNSGGGFGVCNPVLEQSPSHFGESKQGEDGKVRKRVGYLTIIAPGKWVSMGDSSESKM
jgi:hypothetical protein